MLTHANCPKLRKTRATMVRFKQWIYERLAPVSLKIFVAEQNKTIAVIKLKFLKGNQIILERAGYVWFKRGITSSALLIFFSVLLQSTTDMFITEEAAKEVEVSCLCRRIKKIKAPLSNFGGLVCCLGFPFYPFFFFQELYANHSVPAAERTIQQSLENIQLNCAWLGCKSFYNARDW